MRDMKFKMEIKYEHIVPGAEVDVEESQLQGGLVVYYTIIPAIAMSGNFPRHEALKNLHGKVTNVEEGKGGAYYVTVSFEE
ncbi:MAG: hypothetical protein K5894_08135 [Lachnospiraceae bacterium]|nr:hypothetical protein [Lachnospiraceae bacterium]MDN4744077.1 hypothetical protein [Lachnospiraceae bacterium C1.1]